MTQRGEEEADRSRIDRRADLLPEEATVGSDDPEERDQAYADVQRYSQVYDL